MKNKIIILFLFLALFISVSSGLESPVRFEHLVELSDSDVTAISGFEQNKTIIGGVFGNIGILKLNNKVVRVDNIHDNPITALDSIENPFGGRDYIISMEEDGKLVLSRNGIVYDELTSNKDFTNLVYRGSRNGGEGYAVGLDTGGLIEFTVQFNTLEEPYFDDDVRHQFNNPNSLVHLGHFGSDVYVMVWGGEDITDIKVVSNYPGSNDYNIVDSWTTDGWIFDGESITSLEVYDNQNILWAGTEGGNIFTLVLYDGSDGFYLDDYSSIDRGYDAKVTSLLYDNYNNVIHSGYFDAPEYEIIKGDSYNEVIFTGLYRTETESPVEDMRVFEDSLYIVERNGDLNKYTLNATLPNISTGGVYEKGDTFAYLETNIDSMGDYSSFDQLSMYVYTYENGQKKYVDNDYIASFDDASYSDGYKEIIHVENLKSDTKYYYKAKGWVDDNLVTGELESFTTDPHDEIVLNTVYPPTTVDDTLAIVKGEVVDLGTYKEYDRPLKIYMIYKPVSGTWDDDGLKTDELNTYSEGEYSFALDDLKTGTSYDYSFTAKAKVEDSDSDGLWDTITSSVYDFFYDTDYVVLRSTPEQFTTGNFTAPDVEAWNVTEIGQSRANLVGFVNDTGSYSSDELEAEFRYAKKTNYEESGGSALYKRGDVLSNFNDTYPSYDLEKGTLEPNTSYVFEFAVNDGDVRYGSKTVNFTTLSLNESVPRTLEPTNLQETYLTFNGLLEDIGDNSKVTGFFKYGLVGDSSLDVVNESKTEISRGGTEVDYTFPKGSLSTDTDYKYRFCVYNESGDEICGVDKEFTLEKVFPEHSPEFGRLVNIYPSNITGFTEYTAKRSFLSVEVDSDHDKRCVLNIELRELGKDTPESVYNKDFEGFCNELGKLKSSETIYNIVDREKSTYEVIYTLEGEIGGEFDVFDSVTHKFRVGNIFDVGAGRVGLGFNLFRLLLSFVVSVALSMISYLITYSKEMIVISSISMITLFTFLGWIPEIVVVFIVFGIALGIGVVTGRFTPSGM